MVSSERIYRDSVHNIIRVDTGDEVGALVARLIDTPEFQRLRRIRQLGLAHFAYQAAEHSRFTHSLGAYHLATRILNRLASKYSIPPDDRTAVRIAALVHDIGHGPFSHVVESILGFHHEDFSARAVLSSETAIGRLLLEFSPTLSARVASLIQGSFAPVALSQLVSSQLDVDRMDYLLRDSLMTGVKYGIYDLEWIIKSLEIDEAKDRLYISASGIYAVEDYLQARYYMYRQVYFHRTLRSAEAVLHSLLRRVLEMFAKGEPIWVAEGTAMEKVVRGEKLNLADHLSLDDSDFLFHIKRWCASDDPILSDLSDRFLNRRLFKAFDLDMKEGCRREFVANVRSLVAEKGLDPEYYVFEDTGGDMVHSFYAPDNSIPKDLIFIEDGFSRSEIREISEVSSAVRGLQKGYRIHRLCFPAEFKNEVAELYHR
ncbi:MAG: HD domain-containing protein [Pyrinomonadaceae bacterium]